LAATSVAEGFGTMCADFVGIFIQSCLYRANGISGGIVTCPIPPRHSRWHANMHHTVGTSVSRW
jgi:hypothetical protein